MASGCQELTRADETHCQKGELACRDHRGCRARGRTELVCRTVASQIDPHAWHSSADRHVERLLMVPQTNTALCQARGMLASASSTARSCCRCKRIADCAVAFPGSDRCLHNEEGEERTVEHVRLRPAGSCPLCASPSGCSLFWHAAWEQSIISELVALPGLLAAWCTSERAPV